MTGGSGDERSRAFAWAQLVSGLALVGLVVVLYLFDRPPDPIALGLLLGSGGCFLGVAAFVGLIRRGP